MLNKRSLYLYGVGVRTAVKRTLVVSGVCMTTHSIKLQQYTIDKAGT